MSFSGKGPLLRADVERALHFIGFSGKGPLLRAKIDRMLELVNEFRW